MIPLLLLKSMEHRACIQEDLWLWGQHNLSRWLLPTLHSTQANCLGVSYRIDPGWEVTTSGKETPTTAPYKGG